MMRKVLISAALVGITLPGCRPYLMVTDWEMQKMVKSGEAVPWCIPQTYLVTDSICEYYFDWNRKRYQWEGINFCEPTKTRNR
jgi:hypothetical protein